MRAVDERIAEETARRIEQFIEAGFADGGVRPDPGRRLARPRRVNEEALAPERSDRGDFDGIDARKRRRRRLKLCQKGLGARALDFDQHTLRIVAHEAAERQPRREAISVRL